MTLDGTVLALQGMEHSVAKRETIVTKGKIIATRKGPDMTEHQLKKACADLEKSIQDTNQESQATDQRIVELDDARASLAAEMEEIGDRIAALRADDHDVRREVDKVQIHLRVFWTCLARLT